MLAETLALRRLDDPAREHQYHQVILAEADKLSRMIGDVLSFARLRDGLPVYRLDATDLGATVRGIVDTYGAEWEARGVPVAPAVEAALPPVAHDPQAISQLLLNLVDNAIRWGGADGGIEIRVGACDGGVRVAVRDHGRGIDPERLRRIRRDVRRGRIVEEAEGSGLGLALVRRIAAAHGAVFVLDLAADGDGLQASIDFTAGATT
jgi:signal transduction histidine kinase